MMRYAVLALAVSTVAAAAPARAAKPTAAAIRSAAEDLLDEASADIKRGKVDTAVLTLQRCIKLDHAYGACPRALGIAYGRLGDEHKAAFYYRLYLKTTPAAPDAGRVQQLIAAYESTGETVR